MEPELQQIESPEMEHDMEHLSRAEIEVALTAAAEQRNRPVYNKTFALYVRWENDDTHADRDGVNFQRFLDTFGLGTMEVQQLSSNDVAPGWSLFQRLNSIVREADDSARASGGRSLVVFHYGGHGIQGPDGSLLLTSPTNSKSINVEQNITTLFGSPGPLPYEAPVDIIYIFDCCFSFLTTRAFTPSQRVVEVLAATDSNSPMAFVPGSNVSFTAKLAAKAHALKQQGYPSVEVAELISILREESKVKHPCYAIKLGTSSIRLPFPGSRGPRISLLSPSQRRAVFHINLSDDLTKEELKAFVEWINSLPSGGNITVQGVYNTASTCIILQAPYSLFLKLHRL